MQPYIQWPGHGSNQMSINRGVHTEDVVHRDDGRAFSHKREWNWVIWKDLDGLTDCHTEGSKSEREKQTLYINTYTWNLEKWYRWPLLAKQKETHRWREQTHGYQEGGMNREVGIDIHTLWILCLKQITNENVLHRTGNSTPCSAVTLMGRKPRGDINIYI